MDLKTIFDPNRMPQAPPDLTLTDLPPEWHLAWDERAAIREFDGGLHRERAEAMAMAMTDILAEMRRIMNFPGRRYLRIIEA